MDTASNFRLGAGQVITRADRGWDEARTPWQLAVDQQPAAIALPRTPDEVVAAVLDARTGRVRYCNAGHEPPLLCQPGEAPQRLSESAGPPLCVIADFPYESGELELRPGAWLCAVSDGVTEAMNPRGELYGAPRLLAALAASGSSEPQAVLAAVREDVRRFAAGAEQSDDVTLVCVRWNGASGC
jgi:serine phosphatase RsbU (regulator of sigma subunit)